MPTGGDQAGLGPLNARGHEAAAGMSLFRTALRFLATGGQIEHCLTQ